MTKFILYTHHKAYENIKSPFVRNSSSLKILPSAFGGQGKVSYVSFLNTGSSRLHCCESPPCSISLLEDVLFSNLILIVLSSLDSIVYSHA